MAGVSARSVAAAGLAAGEVGAETVPPTAHVRSLSKTRPGHGGQRRAFTLSQTRVRAGSVAQGGKQSTRCRAVNPKA